MSYSVLVVDDEDLTLRTVSRGLRQEGFEVFTAASGEDALRVFGEEKPDLTLRALLKELADRGLAVSYFALWNFLQHEGVTFKKKPSRLRAGPTGRRQAA